MRLTLLQLGVTTQQRIGLAVVVAVLVGWAAYLVLHLGRTAGEVGSEMELAPNRRPYLDDEGLEGPRLDRVLLWSAVLIGIVAIGLPLYWVKEPARQAGAVKGFDKRAAQRGFVLFQPTTSAIPEGNIGHFGCGGCHGTKGEGGVTPFAITDYLGRSRIVQWQVPALDTVLKRFADDEVKTIIVYGRANTPMPAWGIEGGGPMNAQQITDLLAYIKSIQISDEDAMKRAVDSAKTEAQAEGKSPADGSVLFNVNCARCHTKGWSYGEPEVNAGGAFGPSLLAGDPIRQFPGFDDHLQFLMTGSEFGKPYGTRGVGTGRMPGFARMLTPEQISAIVGYERSLP
ncbi:MAG: c-type cytochrome [Actinobacteria bacterium]|nr:c-type cytochrome [Actinomycetota bacterium]